MDSEGECRYIQGILVKKRYGNGKGVVEELGKNTEFRIVECANVAAKKDERYSNCGKRTLQFMLVLAERWKDPPEKRTLYRAIEYMHMYGLRLPERLDKMVGGFATIHAGCTFVKNTFLLGPKSATIRPPDGEELVLSDKPTTRVKGNSSGISEEENAPVTMGEWNQQSQVGRAFLQSNNSRMPINQPTSFPVGNQNKNTLRPANQPTTQINNSALSKEEEAELDALLEDIF